MPMRRPAPFPAACASILGSLPFFSSRARPASMNAETASISEIFVPRCGGPCITLRDFSLPRMPPRGMRSRSVRSGRANLEYMQLQLTELLTRYGPVVLIWFDGLDHQEKYDGRRFLDLIHSLQPPTLLNDRIGVPGDYVTPEQFIPSAIPIKQAHFSAVDQSVNQELKPGVPRPEDFQLWETCMTINNTWAYNKNDHEYKSAQYLIRALVEVASRGGDLL